MIFVLLDNMKSGVASFTEICDTFIAVRTRIGFITVGAYCNESANKQIMMIERKKLSNEETDSGDEKEME